MEMVTCLNLVLAERGEITPHRTDEAFLIRFLRARRFQVEKAHTLVRELSIHYLTCNVMLSFTCNAPFPIARSLLQCSTLVELWDL